MKGRKLINVAKAFRFPDSQLLHDGGNHRLPPTPLPTDSPRVRTPWSSLTLQILLLSLRNRCRGTQLCTRVLMGKKTNKHDDNLPQTFIPANIYTHILGPEFYITDTSPPAPFPCKQRNATSGDSSLPLLLGIHPCFLTGFLDVDIFWTALHCDYSHLN